MYGPRIGTIQDGLAKGYACQPTNVHYLESVSNLPNSSAVVVGRSVVEQSMYNPSRPVSNAFAHVTYFKQGLTIQAVLVY